MLKRKHGGGVLPERQQDEARQRQTGGGGGGGQRRGRGNGGRGEQEEEERHQPGRVPEEFPEVRVLLCGQAGACEPGVLEAGSGGTPQRGSNHAAPHGPTQHSLRS